MLLLILDDNDFSLFDNVVTRFQTMELYYEKPLWEHVTKFTVYSCCCGRHRCRCCYCCCPCYYYCFVIVAVVIVVIVPVVILVVYGGNVTSIIFNFLVNN